MTHAEQPQGQVSARQHEYDKMRFFALQAAPAAQKHGDTGQNAYDTGNAVQLDPGGDEVTGAGHEQTCSACGEAGGAGDGCGEIGGIEAVLAGIACQQEQYHNEKAGQNDQQDPGNMTCGVKAFLIGAYPKKPKSQQHAKSAGA